MPPTLCAVNKTINVMEFFKEIKQVNIDINNFKKLLTISALPNFCNSIDTVLSEQNQEGEIYCVWGQFNIRREIIKYGVRFSLLNCPHALAWTITYNESENDIVVHCTINKKEQDKDFVQSIHQFVSDWGHGIEAYLQNNT